MKDNNQVSSPASTTEGKPMQCKVAAARKAGYFPVIALNELVRHQW